MTYKELYEKALWDLEYGKINLGEFEDMIEPLNKEIPKEEQISGDLISRKAVLDLAKDLTFEGGCKHRCVDVTEIHCLPSAEKTAEWIIETDNDGTYGICSKCRMKQRAGHLAYCPSCGAKMKGK